MNLQGALLEWAHWPHSPPPQRSIKSCSSLLGNIHMLCPSWVRRCKSRHCKGGWRSLKAMDGQKKIPTCCGHHTLHSPSTPLSQAGLRSPLPFQYRQRKSAGGEVEKLLRCHLNSRDRVIFSEAGSVRPPILDLGGKSQQLGYKTSRRQRGCLPSRQLRLSAVRLFKRFFKVLLGKTPVSLIGYFLTHIHNPASLHPLHP